MPAGNDVISSQVIETPCLNCACGEFSVYYEEKDFKVVRCRACGLLYNRPQILGLRLPEIYREYYYKSPEPAFGYEDYVGNKADIQRSFRRRMKYLTSLKKGGKLLDVGCACGFFLEVAGEAGFDVQGIDCSEWATDYARNHYPFKVVTGFLDQSQAFDGKTFEVITCWDVIEQLPSPKALFSKIHSLLAPEGLLVLTVRDAESFMSRFMKGKWIHFRPKEKFAYFSRTTVRNFLGRLGFEVLKITPQDAGKDCTFDILTHKISHANSFLGETLSKLARFLHLDKKTIYLNFLDSLIVVARKRTD